MLAYATRDGYIYWGMSPVEIVDKMRKSEFAFEPHNTNRAYIRSVARRIRDMSGREAAVGMAAMGEQTFLARLVELEYMQTVEGEFDCPIAHVFCMQRRTECSRPDNPCWLKKQEGQ